jgi:hypothetical protein
MKSAHAAILHSESTNWPHIDGKKRELNYSPVHELADVPHPVSVSVYQNL